MDKVSYPDFSVDLVEACLKFGYYFEGMDKENVTLLVDQYKKFWFLIKKYPDCSFAPNTEIDEVWHLHMLLPQNYYYDCMSYFGVILAHDAGFGNQADEVDILNEMFDSGNDLWEKEFGFRLPDENELETKP
ncbi:hypothetical protein [Bacillus altitudinis]|uniref:hypothetical protein n=1 Tax=Bacillus altitudinis TaxID=293387 RepID=UPI0009325CA5|nr:hypothetical protein [Bacillus altitudinis]OJT62535.1 hypothetical protein BFP48_06015 [Bacillus altitudinis]